VVAVTKKLGNLAIFQRQANLMEHVALLKITTLTLEFLAKWQLN